MTTRDVQSTVATSQHTVNYDLPLWNGTDITSWQGNLNDAFNKIDTAMFENKTAMLGYQEIADKLEDTNSSTVELVEQVNQQLTDINAKYDEVKAGLQAANQQITEANQAILALQQEDESVKVQMDTMQDDIGKLMEWVTGYIITLETPIVLTADGGNDTCSVESFRFVGGIIECRGEFHINAVSETRDFFLLSVEDTKKLFGIIGINDTNVVVAVLSECGGGGTFVRGIDYVSSKQLRIGIIPSATGTYGFRCRGTITQGKNVTWEG